MFEIRGDETGRVWTYALRDRVDGPGEGYRATAADDGSLAYIRVCEIGTYWDDDVDRQRNGISIARLPEVRAAPTIRRLFDVSEGSRRRG